MVRSRVIENWESQDNPEHLKTIKNRILRNEQRTARLLGVYTQILQTEEVVADGSSEQMELQLSGLVVKKVGKLSVYNPIYKEVFDEAWTNETLAQLRPYTKEITAWLASDCEDQSCLLRGQKLQDAWEWATGKSLNDEDYQFLSAASQVETNHEQEGVHSPKRKSQIDTTVKDQIVGLSKIFTWFILAVFCGLYPVWMFFEYQFIKNGDFFFEEVIMSGILPIFSTTIVSFVTLDYHIFQRKKSLPLINIFLTLFPILIIFMSTFLFSVSYQHSLENVDFERLSEIELSLFFMAVIYTIFVKWLTLRN